MEGFSSLGEVFGVSRNIPKTYIERSRVDNRFINDLTRFKHIVIHGSSKQGKTCLRKYHLEESDFEVVQCTRNTSKEEIYGSLLKFAGIRMSDTKTTKHSKGNKVQLTLEAAGNLPLLAKIKGSSKINRDIAKSVEVTTKSFEVDISNPNDIGMALKISNFNKYIVLEDFHYLPDIIQESISYDLKAFHDNSSLVFIIIGVWLESNKLILFNGDLSGRINTITADRWDNEDLIRIVRAGEEILNIIINEEAVNEMLSCCYGNVGLFQELAYRLCEEYEIWSTQKITKSIGTGLEIRAVLRLISREEAPRYTNFIKSFCEETKNSKTNVSKWVIKYLASCDHKDLSKEIHIGDIYKYINKYHPFGFKVTISNLSTFFLRIDKIQSKHKIQPIILEYSQKILRVMDVNFIVYLSTHYTRELEELYEDECT